MLVFSLSGCKKNNNEGKNVVYSFRFIDYRFKSDISNEQKEQLKLKLDSDQKLLLTKDYFYCFYPNGVYEEYMSGSVRESGTYTLKDGIYSCKSEKNIEFTMKKNSRNLIRSYDEYAYDGLLNEDYVFTLVEAK